MKCQAIAHYWAHIYERIFGLPTFSTWSVVVGRTMLRPLPSCAPPDLQNLLYVTLHGSRDFVIVIEDLEMGSASLVIQRVPMQSITRTLIGREGGSQVREETTEGEGFKDAIWLLPSKAEIGALSQGM